MLPPHPPIGVISFDVGGYYLGGMLTGIHQITRKAGIPLVVIQQALGTLRMPPLGAEAVAGWIVIHPVAEDRSHLAMLAATAPVVAVPVPIEDMSCTLVQVDNRGGMYSAVAHLIDHGHRRIAYVDHGPYHWSQQRYQGYCAALGAHGIALDPALVIQMDAPLLDSVETHQRRGAHAARSLLERGLPCTALVSSTDTCALAAMQVLQAAGYRVPEDVAVVGFDDTAEAQYADPPLTTVRSPFDMLGRAAATQLLAELAEGRAAPGLVVSVPTTLLRRRSCGCMTVDQQLAEASAAPQPAQDWQPRLVQRVVQLVRYPLPLDPAVPPEQVWPGGVVLVSALNAVLRGEPPSYGEIETAWRQAVAHTENLEVLHACCALLEQAAEQHMTTAPLTGRRAEVQALLRRMRLELMRARMSHEFAAKQHLSDLVRANSMVSTALLDSSQGDAQSLGWLEHSPASWGCLGLWGEASAEEAAELTIVGVYQRGSVPDLPVGQQVRVTAFPPRASLPTEAQRGQELTILCPVRTQTQTWGVLALCGWAALPLVTSLEHLAIQAGQLGAALERNAILAALTAQQTMLEEAYNRERLSSQTIRALGCPIIPLRRGVLLVPLIGAIDSLRAQQIMGAVLEAIAVQQAHTLVLDITGVPVVDTQVARSLLQTAQAAVLLGARLIMVGIRPEIAQSIVSLGSDFQHLTMYATLASALYALQRQALPPA